MSSTAIPSHPFVGPDEATSLAASQRQLHLDLVQAIPSQINNGNTVEPHHVSLERQDMIALQRAHLAIQRRWQQCQSTVCRYQALCQRSIGEHLISKRDSAMRVHLNPLRAWCRLRTTKFLACDVTPPATVLLFAVGDVFATRVFELEGQTLINELADYQPCTLDQWSTLSALANRVQLTALCKDLCETGLICVS